MKKILILFLLLFSFSVNSQTIESVRALIETNLASGTKITAEKHRQVENAIVTLIEKSLFLYKGNYYIGNMTSSDMSLTVTIPNVGTSNYLVIGSILSVGSNYQDDNDVIFSIKDKTATSFKLLLREVNDANQNVYFNYAIIPY